MSTQNVTAALARNCSICVALFLFWVAMSGYFTAFLLLAGLGSALAVTALAQRMHIVDAEGHPVELGWRIVVYWVWLVKEIIKSGWDVSRIILHPRLPISPTLVRFKPSQTTSVGLVVHANSITLTPGTIAIEATPDEFLVHGLTQQGAQGTIGSQMDRRVSASERRA